MTYTKSLTPKLMAVIFLFFLSFSCSCSAQTRIVSDTKGKVLSDLCQDLKNPTSLTSQIHNLQALVYTRKLQGNILTKWK